MSVPSIASVRGRVLRIWPDPGTLLLLAAALILFAPYRHFTTDDAFIHYRFAENVAAGQGWSYNPGVPTNGDTSPLWVLLLAVTAPIAGDVPRAAKALDAAAVTAAILLFATLARRRVASGFPRWAPLAMTSLFLLDPWFLKWGMSGMETPLAMALVLLAYLLRERARTTRRPDPFTPIVLGIGCLVRPECFLLLLALAVEVIVADRGRRRVNLFFVVVLPMIILLPWLLYSRATFGVLFPNTLGARRDLEYSAVYRASKLAKILASAYLLPIAGLLVALGRGKLANTSGIFPLLGTTLVIIFYLAWGVSVGARYLLPFTPCLLLAGYPLVIAFLASRHRVRAVVLLGVAIQLLVVQFAYVRFVTAWPEGMDPRLFELAHWLRTKTPPDAVVAAHEIGVLGYVSGRSILDLASLVSPDVPPVSRTRSVAMSLAAAGQAGLPRPDYLVWNANEHPDSWLLADLSGRLEPLITREVQREGSSHRGGSQYYTIYRVHRESPDQFGQ